MYNNCQQRTTISKYTEEVGWDNDSPEDRFAQINNTNNNVKNNYSNIYENKKNRDYILCIKNRDYNDDENNDTAGCHEESNINIHGTPEHNNLVNRLRMERFKIEKTQQPDLEFKIYDTVESQSTTISTTEEKVKRKMNVRRKKFHRQEIKVILEAVIKAECFVEQLKYQTEDIDTWNNIVREYGFNRRAEDIKKQVVVMLRHVKKAMKACEQQNLFSIKDLKKENDCNLAEQTKINQQKYITCCCMQELLNPEKNYGPKDWWEKEICELLMQINITKYNVTVRRIKNDCISMY